MTEAKKTKTRYAVHITIALIFFISILIFRSLNDRAIIDKLFTIAGYTYGPLLGLYTFGLFTKRQVNDKVTPYIAILSPVICYFLSMYSEELFNGYKFGFELLLLNGFLTFMGLFAFSHKSQNSIFPVLFPKISRNLRKSVKSPENKFVSRRSQIPRLKS